IVLIYRAGRNLFNPATGLIAAALCAFSPICIAMSTFGRYCCQTQFFALLAVDCYWLTIRGGGPIDRRMLWLTALSFIAMFLSWEGSALIAVGMIVACLVQRRGRLHSILANGSVWLALVVVLMAILLQYSHATLVQSRFLWYGISLSDVKLMAMWKHQ